MLTPICGRYTPLEVPPVSRGVPADAEGFLGHLLHTWRIAAAFNGSGTFTEAIRRRLAANLWPSDDPLFSNACGHVAPVCRAFDLASMGKLCSAAEMSEGPRVGIVNPAQQLHQAGQSLWLDSINRRMLTTGTLKHYIDEFAVTGLTSNPTILGHAMAASADYDDSLRHLVAQGVQEPEELVYAAALEDLTAAADLLYPTWEATDGIDGYVSLEIPPGLAYDAQASVEVARRLHTQAGRPNLLVKIPGTSAGLTAMEALVAEGIGINVTLLFSNTHYLQTAAAYLRALERRSAAGQPLHVPSVASVFISRWDKAVDTMLPTPLHGRLGLAMASKVYASYRNLLEDEQWKDLAAAGASAQRVLWASTSSKDPAFPDTYYLGRLAAPDTIDTVPEKTLLAFADHGGPVELMKPDYAAAEAYLAKVATHGIDVDALGESLQRQGARAFEADWVALLETIGTKAANL